MKLSVAYQKYYECSDHASALALLAKIINHSSDEVFELDLQSEFSNVQEIHFNQILARLLAQEPVAYILESMNFMGLDLYINSNVLIPRPETEELVELVLSKTNKQSKLLKILDCCCGSGAIAIALKNFQNNAEITAWDISENALDVARQNSKKTGLSVSYKQVDALASENWKINRSEKFNVIVSNPPYVTEQEYLNLAASVKDYEPKIALLGGESGLDFYQVFALQAPNLLVDGGLLFAEIGDRQANAVLSLFTKDKWQAQIQKDLRGKDRFLVAQKT